MLSFFRRLINSKVGIVVTFVVLGIIALAFAAGDVTNLSTGSGGLTGNDVAKVGKVDITVADLRGRVEEEVQIARQQQPTLDMAGFIAAGGLEGALQRLVTTTALAEFGRAQGMVVSKRAVDGQIASIPALQGPNGQFDEQLYRRILAERKLTDKQVRGDIMRDTLVTQLTGPTIGAAQVPQQLAIPYASLLLERRAGQVGFIPAAAVAAGPAPTTAELQTFYGRNLRRYSVSERRTMRYALVSAGQVRAQPTDAEIAQAYNQDRAKYQPTEKRTIQQVIVADQAGAAALGAKVRGGATVAVAATQAGLEASTLTAVNKADYARQTSAALADQLFAAQRGTVIGPARSPLGFIVARVDAVEQAPGRTLAQARDEIAAALAKTKGAAALADLHDTIDDALVKNSTFDEVIADRKLQARATPPLTAQGINPDAPGQPDPALAPLVTAAFQAEDGDPPQLVQTGPDGSFAVVAVGAIAPAAPRPFAQIAPRVTADFVADRRRQAARRIAGQVLAKVNGDTALPQALSGSGVSTPVARPISASRAQLAQAQGGAEPALALMFSMAQGSAKLLEAPQNAGWLIIKLDRIERADASRNPAAIAGARGDIARLVGRELAEQFARAARAEIGVKTDPNAVSRVRADLTGAN